MNTFNKLNKTTKKELIDFTIDRLKDLFDSNVYGCDLHHEIFNTDYYIIGSYKAEQFLQNSGVGIFGAIDIIKDYEESQFGTISTDLSNAERVCNMLVYIIGEEILNESQHLHDEWENYLTNENIEVIIEEIENI
jgi:hypothetical protein